VVASISGISSSRTIQRLDGVGTQELVSTTSWRQLRPVQARSCCIPRLCLFSSSEDCLVDSHERTKAFLSGSGSLDLVASSASVAADLTFGSILTEPRRWNKFPACSFAPKRSESLNG
jgi:hypothetical protein